MLDDGMKEILNQHINRFPFAFSCLLNGTDKADFHIQNESDYIFGLTHGMILTGIISEFKNHNEREPNQEEMIEVSKIPFERNEELRELILKS